MIAPLTSHVRAASLAGAIALLSLTRCSPSPGDAPCTSGDCQGPSASGGALSDGGIALGDPTGDSDATTSTPPGPPGAPGLA